MVADCNDATAALHAEYLACERSLLCKNAEYNVNIMGKRLTETILPSPARWRLVGDSGPGPWTGSLTATAGAAGAAGRRMVRLPWRWSACEPPAGRRADTQILRSAGDRAGWQHRPVTTRRGVADLAEAFGGAGPGRRLWLHGVCMLASPFHGLLHLSADWWMRWWCDGALILDTEATGNGGPSLAFWHEVPIELAAGRHELTGCITAGAGGWSFGCRASTGRDQPWRGQAIEAERTFVVGGDALVGVSLCVDRASRPLLNGTALPPGRCHAMPIEQLRPGVNRLRWRWDGRAAEMALAAVGLPSGMSSAGRQPASAAATIVPVRVGRIAIRSIAVGCSSRTGCGVTCHSAAVARVALRVGDLTLHSGPGLLHRFHLDGLAPGRWHAATISAGGPAVPIRLRAAADDRLRLGLLSDPSPRPEILRRAVRRLIALRPEAVAMLGDLVANGVDDLDWEEQVYRPAGAMLRRMPVLAVPGNHDAGIDLGRHLCRVGSGPHWAVRLGPVAIIGLDGAQPWRRSGADVDWLDWALAAHGAAPHLLILNHYPAWTSTPHGAVDADGHPVDGRVRTAREVIWPRIASAGASLYLSGHAHCYEDSRPPVGPAHITIGGAGGYLYRSDGAKNPYRRRFRSEHHVAIIEADRKRLRFTAVTLDGKTIATLACKARAPVPMTLTA